MTYKVLHQRNDSEREVFKVLKIRARFRACIWACSKCGMQIQGDSSKRPGMMGCPSGGAHNWKQTII